MFEVVEKTFTGPQEEITGRLNDWLNERAQDGWVVVSIQQINRQLVGSGFIYSYTYIVPFYFMGIPARNVALEVTPTPDDGTIHVVGENGIIYWEDGAIHLSNWHVDGDRKNPEYQTNPGLAVFDAVIKLLQQGRKELADTPPESLVVTKETMQ
jgi:hypothetical protein